MPAFFFLLFVVLIVVWLVRRGERAERLRRIERDLALLKAEVERLKYYGVAPEKPKPTAITEVIPELVAQRSATAPAPSDLPGAPDAAPQPVPPSPHATPVAPLPPPPPILTTAPPQPPPPPPRPPAPRPAPEPAFDWEQFVGVKLFAWLGGLAALFCVAYFIKLAIDRGMIPPALRAAAGFLTGIGLIVGGIFMNRDRYRVTADTLCATGVVVLYSVTFACRAYFKFEAFDQTLTFIVMTLITVAGFLLAVRLRARPIAVLGILGGFLTPILVSTGQDNPLGLFGYITLLDAGLIAVALATGWEEMVALGAAGTFFMQAGWLGRFFTPEKFPTAVAIGLDFDILFTGAFGLAKRFSVPRRGFAFAAAGLTIASFFFALGTSGDKRIVDHTALQFFLILAVDLCLLALVWLESKLEALQLVAGAFAFLCIAIWTGTHNTPEHLPWSLGVTLAFAILHSANPLVLARRAPGQYRTSWGHLFPPVALLVMMLPVISQPVVFLLLWPFVLLTNLIAIVIAVVTGSLVSFALGLMLTLVVMLIGVSQISADLTGLAPMLFVIGAFAILFTAVSLFLLRKLAARKSAPAPETGDTPPTPKSAEWLPDLPPEIVAQLPACSSFLPFFLLVIIAMHVKLVNPSPLFGLALLLAALVLGLAKILKFDWLPAVGLGGVLMVEYAWHGRAFSAGENPALVLAWYLGFAALFLAYPFFVRIDSGVRIVPWATAALSAPLHFGIIYAVVKESWPNDYMGLLPAALAVPMIVALVRLLKILPAENPARLSVLALFGGAALFFITFIFPIQFDRQWLTLGWALEGAALLWLFNRIPHPGLRVVGVALLGVCFARLALNPEVFHYHARSSTPIFNWYLYTYGIVAACLFAAVRLLAPPRHRLFNLDIRGVLGALGVVLTFLLLNIEIADYFTAPGATSLVFEFSGNLARDMTYSIAWSLFALGLLVVGIARKLGAARIAGLILMSVTLLKLFFHDLARLQEFYRVGAFFVVAVIAIFASFKYQQFKSAQPKPDENPPPPLPPVEPPAPPRA
jgi:uncharacterized membrane protein